MYNDALKRQRESVHSNENEKMEELMNLEKFYADINGDFTGVMDRLMKEERVLKYLGKFGAGDEYTSIKAALDAQNYEEAFRLVHSLKGMAANLGLTELFSASDVLCEELRGGAPEIDITDMLADVKVKYEDTIAAIKELIA